MNAAERPSSVPFVNPAPDAIRELLGAVRNIAVVGLSPKSSRPSYAVAKALQGFGYRIIPVRPAVSEVLGEKAYARLADVPELIDLVAVFRAPEHVAAIVDECIDLGLPRLWLQDGVIDQVAARRAQTAGIQVVMDRCLWRDYANFML